MNGQDRLTTDTTPECRTSEFLTCLPLATKVLLTLAFVSAGGVWLGRAALMIAINYTIGGCQWIRFVPSVIEVGVAALL